MSCHLEIDLVLRPRAANDVKKGRLRKLLIARRPFAEFRSVPLGRSAVWHRFSYGRRHVVIASEAKQSGQLSKPRLLRRVTPRNDRE
jgi:hypothetical protein